MALKLVKHCLSQGPKINNIYFVAPLILSLTSLHFSSIFPTSSAGGLKHFHEFLNAQNKSDSFLIHPTKPHYPYFKANTMTELTILFSFISLSITQELFWCIHCLFSHVHHKRDRGLRSIHGCFHLTFSSANLWAWPLRF